MQNGGEAELPEQQVRRALRHLGGDAASAPAVPAGVTAGIGAALRAASPPAAHAINRTRPRLSRLQIVAVILGVGAAAAAVTVGGFALLHNASPTRTFPPGPTAERITVPAPGDTPKAVVTRP